MAFAGSEFSGWTLSSAAFIATCMYAIRLPLLLSTSFGKKSSTILDTFGVGRRAITVYG